MLHPLSRPSAVAVTATNRVWRARSGACCSALSLMLLATLSSSPGVAAAASPPTIVATPDGVSRNVAFSVTAHGLVPNDQISLQLEDAAGRSAPLTRVAADASGNLSVSNLGAPISAALGVGTLQLHGQDPRDSILSTPLAIFGPTLNVNPPAASPSSELLTLTASGFVGGATVDLSLLDGAGHRTDIGVQAVDASGHFGAAFPIPLGAAPGAGSVQAHDVVGDDISAPVNILGASASVSPASAGAHEHISITGSGFVADDGVSVTLVDSSGQGTVLGTGGVDLSGNISITGLVIPASSAGGSATLQIHGALPGDTATIPFTVNKVTLTIQPQSAVPMQDNLSASGSGFAPNEPVSLSLTDAKGQTAPLAQGTADGGGNVSLPGWHVAVPAIGPGSIVLQGASGASTSTAFTILGPPSMKVTPVAVQAGQPITVTGSAFWANQIVGLSLVDGSGKVTALGQTVTDNTGNFAAANLALPASVAAGFAGSVHATTGGVDASVPFKVAGATLSVNVVAAVPMQAGLRASGSGFAPGESVSLSLLDAAQHMYTLAQGTADGSGNLALANWMLPVGVTPGAASIQARGAAGDSASAGLNIPGPTANVAPASAGRGQGGIALNASGFSANEGISVTLIDAGGQSWALGRGASDGSGTVSPVSLSVPSGATPGAGKLQVQGGFGDKTSVPFTVTP
ncbi:MAG: hypothetical protein JOZ81_14690 [Chloroflexi bacterium]|nr:hypothetical protein [Chloroflexota bacterium]